MKKRLFACAAAALLTTTLCMGAQEAAQDDGAPAEKSQGKLVEHFRRLSEKFMNHKMEPVDADTPDGVRKAAAKIHELRIKQGQVFKEMSDAYAKKDSAGIERLEKNRADIEREVKMAETEKRLAWTWAEYENAAKSCPSSEELRNYAAGLRKKIDDFTALQSELGRLEQKRDEMDKDIDSAKTKIKAIVQKEKLKKAAEKPPEKKKQ